MPFFTEKLKEKFPLYDRRFRVRPGITGWSQIKHPSDLEEEDVRQKLRYDFYYIENISLNLDLKILKLLQNDGRETASKIAEKLNLTVPTITERIKKLQDSSVLKGFQAIIDPKSVSLDVSAVITVVASTSANYKVVIEKAVECPEVIQCFATTGVGSLLLWVAAKNTQSLEELLRRIQNWPDVTRTETQIY